MNKVFIYDDVLLDNIQNILNVHPISERIAEVEGKMYMVHRTPILLKLKDVTRNRGNRKCFGAIFTFEPSDMERVLNALDSYKGVSLSRIGITNPHDFAFRSIIQAYPITFKNIHEFETFNYRYERPEECYVYYGNPNHPNIIYSVTVDRHHKLSNGFANTPFKQLLKRSGYIE